MAEGMLSPVRIGLFRFRKFYPGRFRDTTIRATMGVACGYQWGLEFIMAEKKDPTSFKMRVKPSDIRILESLSKLFGISRSGVVKLAIRRLWEVTKERWKGGRTSP